MSAIMDELVKSVRLSPNEEAIASYVEAHSEEIPSLSAHELARRTYTSTSAVLRFVKKLGFAGYNDFRLHIVTSLKDVALADLDIIGGEDTLTMVSKMSELECRTIERAKDLLSIEELEQACSALRAAQHIDFIANDANAAIAEHATHNFFLLGKIAAIYHSNDFQLLTSLSADATHIAIVITKYGETPFINDAAKMFKERGIPTIAILSPLDRFLEGLCDYTFYGISDPQFEFIGGIQFDISAKYLLDLFFASVYAHDYEKHSELVHAYHQAYQKALHPGHDPAQCTGPDEAH